MNAAAEADARAEAAKLEAQQAKEAAKAQAEYDRAVRDLNRPNYKPKPKAKTTTTTRTRTRADNPAGDMLGSRVGQTVIREVLRGIFSTLKRK